MKKIILFLALLFAPAAFAQNAVVSGNLQDLTGVPVTTNDFFRLRLRNYTGFVPKVNGTAIILPTCGQVNTVCKDFTPNGSGVISGTIYGNDQITPAGTYYTGEFWQNGRIAFSCDYLITGNVFNLNTAACLSQATPIGPNQLITQSFICSNFSASLTWTCNDNFNDNNVEVTTYNLIGIRIFPDTLTVTNPNVVTITWVTPQAGIAVIMHTGSISLATNQPNAVLQNPTGSQTISNSLTLGGPFSSSGPNILNGTTTIGGGLTLNGTTAINGGLTSGNYCILSPGETINTAIAASCSTIDDRSGLGSRAIGTVDVGAQPTTILLGPYSYTAVQITLRSALRIIGAGPTAGGSLGTTITSISVTNQPAFVLPQANNGFASHVHLSGFNLIGAAGNATQDAFFMDCSGFTNSGLWDSIFEDIQIFSFQGIPLHFKGRNADALSINQISQFRNIIAIRPNGSTANTLRIEGSAGQLHFIDGQLDGPGLGNNGTNIYIGTSVGGTQAPNSITLDGVTSQAANIGIQFNGCVSCSAIHMHHENLNGGYLFTKGAGGAGSFQNTGISIKDSAFFGTVGVNAGNGYIVTNSDTQTDAIFETNQIYGTPDHITIGTNLASFKMRDNFFASQPISSVYSGTTMQLTPAATINTFGAHTVYLNTSATQITTLNSTLGPGEYISFICSLSNCVFATGGNIDLTGITPPLSLATNETVTFVRNDLNSTWRFVATSTAQLNGKSTSIGPLVSTVASGTASMTTALIAAGACGTTVTISSGNAANVVSTDVLNITRNSAVTNANGGILTLNSWVLTGSVNFNYCNPTSASVTPTAMTINWNVLR